jgi:hypothetical protein
MMRPAEWMQDGISKGYSLYYLNFMFDQLRGSPDAVGRQMRSSIKKVFYNQLCKQCAHHPKASGERHKLPELMLYLDLPVFKRGKIGRTLRTAVFKGSDPYRCNSPKS